MKSEPPGGPEMQDLILRKASKVKKMEPKQARKLQVEA